MKKKTEQSGLTLTETIVVVSIVAVFTVLGIPAIRAFFHSIESVGGARAMISASLSSARAMAAREQHYAGIRFQHRYQPDGKGCQYMIFIIYDSNLPRDGVQGNLGCCAVEGYNPIKLPDSVGVMEEINGDSDIDNDTKLANKTTFSILFSPSGKLVVHELWVINKDGYTASNLSKDDIFNTQFNVQNGIGMFFQDKSGSLDLPRENSQRSFIIYDRNVFEKVNPLRRYTDYLSTLDVVYINPYTGTMINK